MNCTFYMIVKIFHKCLNICLTKNLVINLRLWARRKNSFITFNAQVNELTIKRVMCKIEDVLNLQNMNDR